MRLAIVILLSYSTVSAQDSLQVKKLQYNGYVKDLQSLTFLENFTNPVDGNLIHNRFNIRWTPSDRFSAAIEFRNRFFWGEEVKLTPDFSSRLRNTNELVDLSFNLLSTESLVLNSTVDRMWVAYEYGRWNVRAGRQRINWGIGTTWNPNDLFNTYNFLDFDYEERPGADAIKVQYNTGTMNHIEAALSASENRNNVIGAIKYFVNTEGYDLQLIGGWFHQQPTAGLGWSGNIRESGFKGEVQYYFQRGRFDDLVNITAEIDHMYEKGWYVSGGLLFNSRGMNEPESIFALSTTNFSPQNLMPAKWNTILSFSKEINPLLMITVTTIYSPGANLLLFLPSAAYSLTDNLDFSVTWQSFFAEQNKEMNDLSHRAFMRLKYSF